MSLTEIVERIHKVGKNQIIVDFNNNYSVAYEKVEKIKDERVLPHQFFEVSDGFVLPQIIPPLGVLNHDFNWQIKCSLGLGKLNSFSQEFWDAIKDYKSQSFERSGDLDAKTKQLYRKMIAPLELETFKSKYWGSAIAYKCFPLLVIAGLFLGGVPCIESMSAAAQEKDFYRIKNKSLLKKNCDGKSPAIYEDWRLQINNAPKIKPNKINAYWGVSLLFPPNNKQGGFINLKQSVPAVVHNKTDKKADGSSSYDWCANKYGCSKYYLSVEETLRKELYTCVNKRETELTNWQNFKDGVTKENQFDLLKSIGFI